MLDLYVDACLKESSLTIGDGDYTFKFDDYLLLSILLILTILLLNLRKEIFAMEFLVESVVIILKDL